MRRTNKEFYAEVCRRKSEILRAKKARNKCIFTVILCLPFCYMALMLAIAMQPAGSAAPNDNKHGNTSASSYEAFVITEDDTRFEPIREFFADVAAREPEKSFFDWDLNRSFSYKVTVLPDGKIYYLNNMYVFDGENTFVIGLEEYGVFRDIIIREGGQYYEK